MLTEIASDSAHQDEECVLGWIMFKCRRAHRQVRQCAIMSAQPARQRNTQAGRWQV